MIESYWNKFKMKVKSMKGLEGIKVDEYLQKWMFRDVFFMISKYY